MLTGPLWLAILVVIGLVLRYGPSTIQSWRALEKRNQKYEWEKKRLELRKLRYEIEAIKKSGQLPELQDEEPFAVKRDLARSLTAEAEFDGEEELPPSFPHFGANLTGASVGVLISSLAIAYAPFVQPLIPPASAIGLDSWSEAVYVLVFAIFGFSFFATLFLSFLPIKNQTRRNGYLSGFITALVYIWGIIISLNIAT